jgi:hypothetical protein
MESLTRRIAAWPAWRRRTLVALTIGAFWAVLVLTLRWPGLWPRALCLILLAMLIWWFAYVIRAAACVEAQGELRREDRRYLREFVPAMIAYFAIMLFVWPLHKTADATWLKGLIALLPALPIAGVAVSMFRYVTASDEFMQRLHLQALAVAAGVIAVGSMAVGFLSSAKVLVLDGSALLLVFPALCVTYGLTLAWAKRRYGD